MSDPQTKDGYGARFIVNVVAPYSMTQELLPLLGSDGRAVNLSSAAQSPVDLNGFISKRLFTDSEAYAQSKIAMTIWSFDLAKSLGDAGPMIVAVKPAPFLGNKMVKEAHGRLGHDLRIRVDTLARAVLSDEFASASGRYYNNDQKALAQPHPDAFNQTKNKQLISAIE